MNPGNRYWLPATLIVFAALAASAILVGLTTAQKTSIEHDEGITFLAAAGTQALYEDAKELGSGYAGEWVDAAKWRDLVEQPRPFTFGTIRHDLAYHDIHPPAYFWLLHLWSLVFGLSPASSIALGVVIAMATGIALFVLAMRVLGDGLRASGVVVFWALATPVVDVSIIARHYGLLALVSVLAVLAAHDLLVRSRPGMREGALFAMVAALGIATHYHFAIVLFGILVWVMVDSAMLRDARPALVAGFAAIAGSLLFWVMHPDFLASFKGLEQALAQASGSGDFLRRVERAITSVATYFLPPSLIEWGLAEAESLHQRVRVLIIFGVGLLTALLVALRAKHRKSTPGAAVAVNTTQRSTRFEVAMLFLGVWVTGAIVYLYLTGESPAHAMGPRYLAAAWPFLAFLPVALLRRFDSRIATVVVIAWSLGVFLPVHMDRLAEPLPTATMRESVYGAERIVIDSVERGILPRILVDTDPESRIFAANQPVLFDRAAEWIDVLEPGDIVVSSPMYAANPDGRQIIESLLLERYTVEVLDGPKPFIWWRITGSVE